MIDQRPMGTAEQTVSSQPVKLYLQKSVGNGQQMVIVRINTNSPAMPGCHCYCPMKTLYDRSINGGINQ